MKQHNFMPAKAVVLELLDEMARANDWQLESADTDDDRALLRLRTERDRAFARAAGYRDDDRLLTTPDELTYPHGDLVKSVLSELSRLTPGPLLYREGIDSVGLAPGRHGGTEVTLRWGVGVRSAGREFPLALHAIQRGPDEAMQLCRPFVRPIDRVTRTQAGTPRTAADQLAGAGKVVLPPVAGAVGRIVGVPLVAAVVRALTSRLVPAHRRVSPFEVVLPVEPEATAAHLPREERVVLEVVRPQLAAMEDADPRGVAEIRKVENQTLVDDGAMTAVQATRLGRRIDRCFPGARTLPVSRDDRTSRNLLLGAHGAAQWRADRLLEEGVS